MDGHRADLEPAAGRCTATLAGRVVADSTRALLVRETRHDPVVYFPKADVRLDLAEPTDHRTWCPFKGNASYWTFHVGDASARNVAWAYDAPLEPVAGLKDHVAFYPDRVEIGRAPVR